MKLHELAPPRGATHPAKRLGRGRRSGHGKTSGRGQKGQRARSGHGIRLWMEGGQMPLVKRLPKRGFHPWAAREMEIVNVGSLDRFPAGAVVDPPRMHEQGLIRDAGCHVKILGKGTLTQPLVVNAHGFSRGAQRSIVQAGGEIHRLPDRPAGLPSA